jgi:uncharacterized protein
MKTKNWILTTTVAMMVIGMSACTHSNNSTDQRSQPNSPLTKANKKMDNQVSIVEIPTSDFPRAVKFYQAILDLKIEETEMDGVQMGIFPNEEGTVNVVLAKGNDYKPTSDGAVVYLNAGEDLQAVLDKIEPNGGKVIVPKTAISPEMGFFALFIDTEGNKLGLHSTK